MKGVNKLEDELVKVTAEYDAKTKFMINETHDTYKVGYYELQSTIRGIRSTIRERETLDEINLVTKDIKYILNPSLTTTNDLSLQMLNGFY